MQIAGFLHQTKIINAAKLKKLMSDLTHEKQS